MKRIFLSAIITLLFMGFSCEKSEQISAPCLKGKLVLKGICMNYVIELVDGNIDSTLIEKAWINPMTKEQYKNVFALGSICTFPSNITEGQEFYFSVVDNKENVICEQCKAYAPAPEKKLYIAVCKTN